MDDAAGSPADAGTRPPRAAEVFTAELRQRPGGRLRHAVRVAGAFLAELLFQLFPGPSVHDVVVSRRADGTEVLRVPAGDPMTAGDVLRSVRGELDRLEAEEFLSLWRER